MINGCFRGSGGLAGLMSAWCIERRFLHYDEISGSWKQKLSKYLIGLIGLTVMFKVLPSVTALILSPAQSAALNGFVVLFYIAGIYPLLVTIQAKHKR